MVPLEREERKEKLDVKDIEAKIKKYKKEMLKAAKDLKFEDAAHFRDLLKYYEGLEIID